MRGSNSVNLLLTRSSLYGGLTAGQAKLVTVKRPWLTTINDSDLLVGAFHADLLLLVVFDEAISLGNIGCRDLWQGIFDLPRRSQGLVIALDSLQCVDLLSHGDESRFLALAL